MKLGILKGVHVVKNGAGNMWNKKYPDLYALEIFLALLNKSFIKDY